MTFQLFDYSLYASMSPLPQGLLEWTVQRLKPKPSMAASFGALLGYCAIK
jgi:hypothetical protein